MSPLPTASALGLARTCAASMILPRARQIAPQLTAGTAKHRYLERVNQVGATAALAEITDDGMRAVCEAIDLQGLPLDPAAYLPEVTFAWSWRTGEARVLGQGLERDYSSVAEDEFVGTADVVALVGDDAILCADWKGEHDDETPPIAVNLQLRFLGMAAALAYHRDRAIIEIIRPRDGRAWRDRAELDMFDLGDVQDELRALAASYERAKVEPTYVVSTACRRCPCLRMGCPAVSGQLRGVVEAVARGVKDSPGGTGGDHLLRLWGLDGTGTSWTVTPEAAGHAKSRLVAIREALDAVDEAIDLVARQEDVPLPDGRVYGVRHETRTTYDGRAVFSAMRQRHGDEAAWSAIEIRAPQTKVEEALKAIAVKEGAKRGRPTQLKRELESDLMGIQGGMTVTPREVLRIHRPKETK